VTGGDDDFPDSLQPLFLIPVRSSSILSTGVISSAFTLGSSFSVDLTSTSTLGINTGSGVGAVVLLDNSLSPWAKRHLAP